MVCWEYFFKFNHFDFQHHSSRVNTQYFYTPYTQTGLTHLLFTESAAMPS